MDFAPIPPTDKLMRYLKGCKTWFALAQIKKEEYVEFYRNRPRDVTLILDNGAYEGEMNLNEYETAIETYKPDVAVLPDDYLGNADRSMHLGLGFLERWEQSAHDFYPAWMFVPQAEPGDVEGFVRTMFTALNDERITWLGIPRCLTTDIIDNPLARPEGARSILKKYPNTSIHALGMINGCIPELYYLQKAGVRSCDSSWPFNHGDVDSNLEAIDRCLTTL